MIRYAIGDKVIAAPPYVLRQGGCTHAYAVVVSVDPLVIASPEGDALWTEVASDNVLWTGKVDWQDYYAAIGRYAVHLGLPARGWKP